MRNAAPRHRRGFKSVMTGCRSNYDGLKLIRFSAVNDRAGLEIVRLAHSSRASVVINDDNYNESADYSDYPVARRYSLYLARSGCNRPKRVTSEPSRL